MNPSSATLIFVVGIAGLFWLNRDGSARTSKALWLPIIWLSINGSRSVSAWLGMDMPKEIPGQMPPASPLDQYIAAALMLLAAMVLIRRRREVGSLLRANWPIILYFSFALVSLLWSDFPAWGFKRWVRALGDVAMVLVVATDAQPIAALKRLFSRIGFIMLPLSVLFIKYYPDLGQGFDPFGLQEFQGVTTNKNALGNLACVLAMGALWQALSLLRDREQPGRARRLLAQFTVVAFGIDILFTAHCATAGGGFILAVALMLVTSLPLIRYRPAAVHVLIFALLLSGGVIELLGARATVTEALGRKPDLTGRTEIWGILIPMVPNPIGGAGFETFWIGPRVAKVYAQVGGPQMTNESHNGYIEVYLNLGWLGVGLIALILGQGYCRAVSAFRRDSALGALLVACVVSAAAFNISEADFRMLGLEWFFLLLGIVSTSIANGVAGQSESPQEFAESVFVAEANPFTLGRDMPAKTSIRALREQ